MQLKSLAKKPELVEIVLDDEDTIKEHNEPITFHTWDRAPLDVFSKLAGADPTKPTEIIETVRKLILDEEGREILAKDQMLPPTLLIRAIAKIVNRLGN
jgi:hypothetical protein